MSLVTRMQAIGTQNPLVKHWFRKMRSSVIAALYATSPDLLAKYRYRIGMGRWPNLNSPKTFDEKLMWLMLYWRHPLKTQCGDKFAVRSYVETEGLAHLLPVLLGVFESTSEIDLDALPEQFVLKCTHGCGFNIICKDKQKLNWEQARRKLDSWMKIDFATLYGEVHYSGMKPRIVCEPYLSSDAGAAPNDYKVYCFDGKAHCTMACTSRGQDGHNAAFDIYDRNWTCKLPYSKSSLLANRSIPKPESYEEMIAASEHLSRPFPFVRVDFYDVNGKALLGEMTFTPCGCVDKGYTDLGQHELGRLVNLPQKRMKWD